MHPIIDRSVLTVQNGSKTMVILAKYLDEQIE